MKFFSDQNLSYADILLPHEARARIEVSVLNLLRILNSPDPAISDLSLSQCGWLELWVQKQCGLSSELLKILEGLSPNVPLYKMNEGNEPCFFTTYFCWDPTKAIAQGNSFQKKAVLLFGTHHVVEDKSNGGNQGPRQRAEALAALNSASTTYHVRNSGNQVQKFRLLMMH
ncbi:villin-3 isoform X1 [Arabidopsis lyrata subsp. lyrata]|uniref:villin-3 isoform X1 n=1 Tax=Arabidopsis lyrata subsp. lyrata TaxID=81972 RepID=UPI000A29BDF6|nr:villin-3 isoform X1 [Arabidopsis lyrata subsp. lyrata]XP_020883819.1 villin-3 isoform X1 [Arabidopsis lyrata subsp. lyrata]|eukprot:XP_020883818.1 villin-3 isoform X1 [Arabidopsis lyrata subsp. lyrata]